VAYIVIGAGALSKDADGRYTSLQTGSPVPSSATKESVEHLKSCGLIADEKSKEAQAVVPGTVKNTVSHPEQ
jgi:hypothetical protein